MIFCHKHGYYYTTVDPIVKLGYACTMNRVTAAYRVAHNWRIWQQLPRLALLAKNFGLISHIP